jgi:calcineurin-like phosphoesterase family protein
MNNLVTADIHLSDNPAEAYRHAFMEDFAAIARKRKPNVITILGDLTEKKDFHSAILVNKTLAHLKALSEQALTFVLMGNHDYHNEGHPFFEFVQHVQNIKWIGRPTEFSGSLYLPHTRHHEKDWQEFKPRFKGYDFIFCHNTFNGANVGFGRELEGIPIEYFPKTARVIAGDVHVPQTLGPVTYAGAPYHVDYGDDYKARVLWLEGRAMQSISVASFPQKRLVTVDDIADLSPKGLNEGDLLKVRVNVDDMGTWHSTQKAVVAWAEKNGFICHRIEPVLTKHAVRKRVRVVASKLSSDEEVLTQYGKRHGLTDHTLKAGISLLEDDA